MIVTCQKCGYPEYVPNGQGFKPYVAIIDRPCDRCGEITNYRKMVPIGYLFVEDES